MSLNMLLVEYPMNVIHGTFTVILICQYLFIGWQAYQQQQQQHKNSVLCKSEFKSFESCLLIG